MGLNFCNRVIHHLEQVFRGKRKKRKVEGRLALYIQKKLGRDGLNWDLEIGTCPRED